jgi:hypothetical protein
MHANKGVFALLIGSGVSRASGIPTGWDIILDLVRRLAQAAGEDCGPKPDVWFTARYGAEPSYSGLLDMLASSPGE